MRSTPKPLRTPLLRRLLPLGYGLVAVVALILAFTWASLQIQVTLAGFLNGESVWSKAQKQAVIDLDAYATGGAPVDLAKFRNNYAILKSDAAARDAIASGHYNRDQVIRAFGRGSVIPSAIPGMIFILDHFSTAPYIREALKAWYSVGPQIDELGVVAAHLERLHEVSAPTAAQIAAARRHIRELNEYITPRANTFSLEIALGAGWIGQILFCSTLGAAALALLLWLLMARRVLAGIRGSEERYRLLFDSAADAIVMVDEDSDRILDANRTAVEWSGRDPEELLGKPYAGLFQNRMLREGSRGRAELKGVDGSTRPVETLSSMTAWGERTVRQAIIRDVSERVASDRARRIAAEALASIGEGVIIADAGRRVLSANAAATQITGFATEDLIGSRFDEMRGMADGSPLPQAVWDKISVDRHWSGEVQARRHDGSAYAERLSISTIRDADRNLLNHVAVFSDMSEAKADRHRLEHLATHDPLTGLANRAEFQRRCEEAIQCAARNRTVVSVLFIDLDAFKIVNDSYSHAVGDSLLKQVARRIRHQLGDNDVIGRIGGDEFTVLLSGQTLREDAAGPATRLLASLSEPFQVEGYEVALSASIGIAGFPLDGDDAQTLMANADSAMYTAKTEERNAWRFYLPMMQDDARYRMTLATELRQAFHNDEFRLVYQPSIELNTGRIVAAEALLRWQHPKRGEVMPGEFIPVAESIGVIHRIDEWVMHSVCAQIHAWNESDMPPLRVAINVSARWFAHPGFIESVRCALQVNHVDAQRIVLEITEGAMLRLGEETQRTMRALHAMGVSVAIDDFGTGYASMAYLKLPAVAYMKIDRSFVTGLPDNTNDAAITQAMLAMATSLGLTAVAEGVETEAQHQFLVGAGCTEGQGFLYSYPLPAATLERKLKPNRAAGSVKLTLVPPGRA